MAIYKSQSFCFTRIELMYLISRANFSGVPNNWSGAYYQIRCGANSKLTSQYTSAIVMTF